MSFDDLPEEILEKIVYEMDGDTLKQFCLVSKQCSLFLLLPNIKKSVFYKAFEDLNLKLNRKKKLDQELEVPIDEVQAFELEICKNSWEDSYQCYKKCMSQLEDIPRKTAFKRFIPTTLFSFLPWKLVPFLLFLFVLACLVYSTFKISFYPGSSFSSSVLAVAFTSLLFFRLYIWNGDARMTAPEWISLLLNLFFVYFYFPLFFVNEWEWPLLSTAIVFTAIEFAYSFYFGEQNIYYKESTLPRLYFNALSVVVPLVVKEISPYLTTFFDSNGFFVTDFLARIFLRVVFSFLLSLLGGCRLVLWYDRTMALSLIIGTLTLLGFVFERVCSTGSGLWVVVGTKVGGFLLIPYLVGTMIGWENAREDCIAEIVEKFRCSLICDFGEPNKTRFTEKIMNRRSIV